MGLFFNTPWELRRRASIALEYWNGGGAIRALVDEGEVVGT